MWIFVEKFTGWKGEAWIRAEQPSFLELPFYLVSANEASALPKRQTIDFSNLAA